MIHKGLELSGRIYYERHLELVNIFLPIRMTDGEIRLLSYILEFKDFNQTNLGKLVGISQSSVSQLFKKLLVKGFILRDGEGYRLNDIIIPSDLEEVYMFRFKKL